MSNQGPFTQKTYSRPADRWPDDLEAAQAGLRKFVALAYGKTWVIQHNLASTDLIIDTWVDSSTPLARYLEIKQLDNNTIIVEWDSPARGKMVVYSLRNLDDSSRVLVQETPAVDWDLPHDLGTTNVLVDFWVDDQRLDPMNVQLREDGIQATFPLACTGKACVTIADPNVNTEMRIRLAQIVDWPTEFVPAPHSHDVTTVTGSQDSLALDGRAPEYYLNISDIGATLCPLEEADSKIALQYIPDDIPFRLADSQTTFLAKKLRIDDTTTPLRLQKDFSDTSVGVVSMLPIFRHLKVFGNIRNPLNIPQLEPNLDHSLEIEAGAGMRIDVESGRKIKLVAPVNAPQLFFYPGELTDQSQWVITDNYFGEPGRHIFYLWETLPNGNKGVLPISGPWSTGGMKMEMALNTVIVENAMGRSVAGLTLVAIGESVD